MRWGFERKGGETEMTKSRQVPGKRKPDWRSSVGDGLARLTATSSEGARWENTWHVDRYVTLSRVALQFGGKRKKGLVKLMRSLARAC
jgi:hypothetical protein